MHQHDCIFCQIADASAAASRVYEDNICVAFLDLFPIRPGHILVIPKAHAAQMEELPDNVRHHLTDVATRIMVAQKAFSKGKIRAHNLLLNDGREANQHVPHVHVHLIPRTGSDTWQVITGFILRMKNVFGQAARRKKLDEYAWQLKSFIESEQPGN